MKSIKFLLLILVMGMLAFASPIQAQFDRSDDLTICSFVGPICEAFGINIQDPDSNATEQTLTFANERISQGLSLIFIGIIIISVFIIVQAGIKYIQSQGEEGKIQEAQKAIKSVFIGIAVLFVGILGIILVLAFFGGTGLLGTDGTSLDDIFLETPTGGSSSGGNACSSCLSNCREAGDDTTTCALVCEPQCG